VWMGREGNDGKKRKREAERPEGFQMRGTMSKMQDGKLNRHWVEVLSLEAPLQGKVAISLGLD
jgi:hypothetical protein